ncbi:hypothetical protein SDC9_73392 [bioreactor metagenome]|uniref:Secretion system C-terminal sorting domain-containing protein n=1 Tax=bioreactor metagenome TaxID=1076179 RepID=A0A644YF68_9ZZZZ
MKKTIITTIAAFLAVFAIAQSDIAPQANINAALTQQPVSVPIKAQWDMQMSFNTTDSTAGSVGWAAIAYFNNEIWASKWASDTLARFNTNGTMIQKFLISGLTGTRSITTDGTYLYIGNNTNTIYRVDPVTATLAPPHITSASVSTSRFLTYDATLNSGAGGFWTGNFNTDIDAISMSGTLLSSIPAATHTLTGMYGAAVDNISSGGPYLWVFHQGGTNNSQITSINLTTVLPTAFTYDVFPDLQTSYGLSSGLAGGCFITNQLVPGQVSFLGMYQGTPDNIAFAIEINPTTIADDIVALSLKPVHGYTQIPESQVFAETFKATFRTDGLNAPDTVFGDVNYYFNSSLIGSEQVLKTNITLGATDTLTSSAFTPSNGTGSYMVEMILSGNAAFSDGDASNDTLSFSFDVTDSIYARDNGISTGTPYSVSSTDWAYAASMYELFQPDTIEAVWIQLETMLNGDTTFGVIYSMSGGMPTTFVASGDTVIINDTINAYLLTFSSPVILPAGQYAFGCYEGSNTVINLSQSNDIYTAGTNFFYIGSSASWSASGVQTARFIHPVFFRQVIDAIEESSENHFNVYPVPASNVLNITFEAPSSNSMVKIIDQTGRVIKSVNILSNTMNQQVDISNLAPGHYFVSWISPTGIETAPIIIE